MRTSEQSPNGVNGLSTLLVESEQLTPWCSSLVRGGDAAHHAVIHVPSHQIEIGRGQHGERHAGVGHALGALVEQRGRCAGELGDVADRDAAAVVVFLGLLADIKQVEIVRARAEVEMHVDVDVELARDLEDAVDLSVRA